MTRRARIRAFLLGLLIGGGSWTAAAHDDSVVPDAPRDGVVADCAADDPGRDDAGQIDDHAQSRLIIGAVERSGPAKSHAIVPVIGQSPASSTAVAISNRVEIRQFVRAVLATVGKQMSGTPPLGLLSGSS